MPCLPASNIKEFDGPLGSLLSGRVSCLPASSMKELDVQLSELLSVRTFCMSASFVIERPEVPTGEKANHALATRDVPGRYVASSRYVRVETCF